MWINKIGVIVKTMKVDNAVSKNNLDYEIGIYIVTLSRSEGSVAMGTEMLRCGSA